ncbi:MAG: hypothetical protein ABJD02_04315 [Paraglaciecola sp.]|uniref:hypothetical protein n=1 Tax=Paraglaciecola sp. TaxID=1920173 RepID=UPI003267E523
MSQNLTANTVSSELHHEGYAEIMFATKLSSSQLPFTLQGPILEGCQYVKFTQYPNVSVMVDKGIITRIDSNKVARLTQNTPFHALVTGTMTFKAFKQTYPKIEVQEHEYENGFYLTWFNQQQDKAIVVDYVNGKVSAIKAGLVPNVLFVEGCA